MELLFGGHDEGDVDADDGDDDDHHDANAVLAVGEIDDAQCCAIPSDDEEHETRRFIEHHVEGGPHQPCFLVRTKG